MTVTNLFQHEAIVKKPGLKKLKSSTAPFSMRLTAEEREYLDANCGGLSWAAYIRECVFGEKAKPRRRLRKPKIDEQQIAGVLSQLGQSRLSSNLNQISRSANMGTIDVSQDVEQQLEDACGAILAMREALIIALGLKPERKE